MILALFSGAAALQMVRTTLSSADLPAWHPAATVRRLARSHAPLPPLLRAPLRDSPLSQGVRSTTPKMQTKTVTPLPATVKPGVVTGTALVDLLSHAKENGYAIPAVNVVSSCSISGCLEAAKKFGGPMIIQFSRGGGQFYAGKAAENADDAACIAGCVAVCATPPCSLDAPVPRERRVAPSTSHRRHASD